MIDIQGIKEALPHRYPMLLVDRVLEVSAWSPHYGSLGSDSRCFGIV